MHDLGVAPNPFLDAPNGASLRDRDAISRWLWIVAGLVVVMVMVGGATRLTQSGLSITEWRPITGVLPPLSDGDWAAEFEKYRQTTQYREMFAGMSISDFKSIYYWEWFHRLLGRFIGVAFLAPLVVFWLRGSLSPKLRDRLIGVLMLGALQGVVGWWMVRSGLAGRTEVAQERLAIHLLLASLTLSALVWLAVGLKPPRFPLGEREASRGWPLAAVVTSLVLLQIVLGALVAGLRAGYVYDTWPLMDGRLAPAFENLFRLRPWSLNLVENPTMVQFQHRMVGYAVALAASAHLAQMLTLARGKPASRRAFALLGLILVQIGLGVATLLSHVQIAVALAHQAVAMAVLIMAVVQTRRLTLAARD